MPAAPHERRRPFAEYEQLVLYKIEQEEKRVTVLEDKMRAVEDGRLYERGYRKGALWIIGIVSSAGGAILALILKAFLKL